MSSFFKTGVIMEQSSEELARLRTEVETLQAENQKIAEALALVKRQAEAERERVLFEDRVRHHFILSASHELRTSLNTVVGFAELLGQGVEDDEEQQRYIDMIQSGGKSLAHLVNDIVELSKLQSGIAEVVNEPTHVAAVVREAVEAFGGTRSKKPIVFETQLAEMPVVCIDPRCLRQLLYNLISNAFKYTERGRIILRTEWQAGTLTLSVSDTGQGISETDIERIAHPFVKVSDRNQRDGAGLGLTICRRLVQLMGGEMAVESMPGMGSTFTIAFQGVQVARTAADASAVQTEVPSVPGRVRASRVLIVDDSSVNRVVLKSMLQHQGVREVVVAENGRQAFDILKADGAIDLVLTDRWMPEMDGEDLVSAIRVDEALAGLPVYLVTADFESVPRVLDRGYTGVLLKPITQADIQSLIQA